MMGKIKKISVAAFLIILGLVPQVMASSSSSSASSGVMAYGSEMDYIWLIGVLLVLCILVFRKLVQINHKNSKYENRLNGPRKK